MLELDDELIAKISERDQEAFDLLVRRHHKPLINFIARFTGDKDNAEDLAQETFIRIYKAADRYTQGRARFKTWMYLIAKNLCKNELRNRSRRERFRTDNVIPNDRNSDAENEEIDLIASAPADTSFQPEVAIQRKELNKAVHEAIANLPEQYRFPLILRDIQGLSYDEISEMLELKSGTTKSRINRARLMLKDKLQPFMELI